jgi:LacI family transcriptional regulator
MEALQKVLQLDNPPTAIFCFSDLVAFGVMLGIRNSGLTPGKDIAVVGFDDIPESGVANPPLTTVSSFARQIGSNAADLLHKRILDFERQNQKIILSPELIVREST